MTITPICFAPALAGDQKYHEQWFLVDTNNLRLTAEECRALEQVSMQIQFGQLQLRAPGMLRLELLLDVIEDEDDLRCQATDATGATVAAIDEGELAAVWFSHVLDRPCKLLKKDPGHPDR